MVFITSFRFECFLISNTFEWYFLFVTTCHSHLYNFCFSFNMQKYQRIKNNSKCHSHFVISIWFKWWLLKFQAFFSWQNFTKFYSTHVLIPSVIGLIYSFHLKVEFCIILNTILYTINNAFNDSYNLKVKFF